jgi:hypothetical protein
MGREFGSRPAAAHPRARSFRCLRAGVSGPSNLRHLAAQPKQIRSNCPRTAKGRSAPASRMAECSKLSASCWRKGGSKEFAIRATRVQLSYDSILSSPGGGTDCNPSFPRPLLPRQVLRRTATQPPHPLGKGDKGEDKKDPLREALWFCRPNGVDAAQNMVRFCQSRGSPLPCVPAQCSPVGLGLAIHGGRQQRRANAGREGSEVFDDLTL